jgi:drug/metabolite transporter (DMT)-like permease
MFAVGLGVTFIGYSLTYYAITQLQGGNWGFWDLTIPNQWSEEKAAIPKDGK